jgi:hypothetical protein
MRMASHRSGVDDLSERNPDLHLDAAHRLQDCCDYVLGLRGFPIPYKGNPSCDGRRPVVLAKNRAGAVVAFAYDITTSIKYPDIELSRLAGTNDYCGSSPSVRYIFCSQVMHAKIGPYHGIQAGAKASSH